MMLILSKDKSIPRFETLANNLGIRGHLLPPDGEIS